MVGACGLLVERKTISTAEHHHRTDFGDTERRIYGTTDLRNLGFKEMRIYGNRERRRYGFTEIRKSGIIGTN